MKSGPTLNPCTVNPRRRNASISPRVTVVLPTPLATPATTMRRGTLTARFAPSTTRVGAIRLRGGPVPCAAEPGQPRVLREARVRLGERATGEHGPPSRLHASRVTARRAEAGRRLRRHGGSAAREPRQELLRRLVHL